MRGRRLLLPLVAAAAAVAAAGAATTDEDTRLVLLLKHRALPARLAEVEAALGLGPNASSSCSNCELNRRASAAARPAFATDVVPVRCRGAAAPAAAASSVAAFAAAGLGCAGAYVEAAERWVGSVVVDRKVPVPQRALLQRSARRDVFNGGSVDVVRTLRVDKYFWRAAAGEGAAADTSRKQSKDGVKGAGVRVAIFDTGIVRDHPHFAGAKVATCVDYTESGSCHDGFGHGSFVAGLIASRGDCLGMTPEAELHVFKVFTDQQVSYTSWFLDAFNHVLDLDVDVLNLSIGGPDYMDTPFTDKVREVVANGVTIVSAIGNDGPLFGTLNNPADMLEVVGVGAVDADKHMASFSSRGMTTWELPQGYGRIKPDVLTYGENLRSTASTGGCRELSGTSVASPVVAGVATEVVAYLRGKGVRESLINPGTVKKVLTSSTRLLDNVSVYEQGTGLLNVADVMANLKKGVEAENSGGGSGSSSSSSAAGQFTLDAPVFLPSALRLEQCKLFWPLCRHPVYATGMPVVLNLTVVNPSSLAATLTETAWQVTGVSHGDAQLSTTDAAFFADNLEIGVEASTRVYPYFGWLSLSVTLARRPKTLTDAAGARAAKPGEGGFVVRGLFTAVLRPERGRARKLLLDLSFRVIDTPPREKRVLWDVFHSMQYPPAYIARDDLSRTSDVLDWNGDHPHTNFKDTFDHVTGAGYFVELLSDSFLAFDAAHYGVLMLVDAEEEYSDEEAAKFEADVRERGLGVLVFAEWHNAELMEKANFVDSNTREMWSPLVGGANLPALNELLSPFGIALSASVYHGAAKLSPTLSVLYKSGCAIQTFPQGGQVFVSESPLTDMVQKAREPRKRKKAGKPPPSSQGVERVPILGLTGKGTVGRGRIGVYGDSGCLDSAHSDRRFCFNLVDALLAYAAAGAYAPSLTASGSFRGGGGGLERPYVNPAPAPPLPARPSANPLLPHSHALGGDKDRRAGRHVFRAIPHMAPLALLGGATGKGSSGDGNSSGSKPRHHAGVSGAPKKKAKIVRAVKVVGGKEKGGRHGGGGGTVASDDDDSVVTNPPDRVRRLALVHARGLTVLLAATVLVVCAYFCSRRRRRRRRKPGVVGGGSSLPL